jgi:hypothetical protein
MHLKSRRHTETLQNVVLTSLIITVKTVKLATLLQNHQIPVIIHCHYFVIWPPVYCESWPQLHISRYAFRVSPTSLCWPTWRVARFLYPTVHGPKFSFMSRTTCCPVNLYPFSTSLDNSSDKWPKVLFTHSVKYSTCFLTLPPVSALWTVHLHIWWGTYQFP